MIFFVISNNFVVMLIVKKSLFIVIFDIFFVIFSNDLKIGFNRSYPSAIKLFIFEFNCENK